MTATVRLNLVPDNLRRRRLMRERTRLWSRVGAILALVWLAGWTVGVGAHENLSDARSALEKLAFRLDAERQRDRQTRADIVKTRELWQRVEPLLHTTRSADLFESVAVAATDEIKLSRIDYETIAAPAAPAPQNAPTPTAASGAGTRGSEPRRPPAIIKVSVEGVAPQHEDVARFLQSLEGSGRFSIVRLIRADRAGNGPNDILRFRVECEARGVKS